MHKECVHAFHIWKKYILNGTHTCYIAQCSEWSTWGECSKTCGGGLRERQRTCEELDAVKIEKDSQVCNNISCEPPCKYEIFVLFSYRNAET